jgi:uncharacterized protein YcgI (DUF1989 family)
MRLINKFHLAPKTGIAFVVVKGQVIRVIDTDGEQVSDIVCFVKGDTSEYLSSSRSIDYNEKIYLSTGNTLYSNLSNPMLTIIRDKVGKHDFLFAPCSQEMFQISYNIREPHPNCMDNLDLHLSYFGINKHMIPTAFNIFLNATITEDGRIWIKPPLSKAGDYIDFQAEMDLVIGITACSSLKCNNYKNTSIDVEVYDR